MKKEKEKVMFPMTSHPKLPEIFVQELFFRNFVAKLLVYH